jgi:hypothetical protein
MLTRSKAMATKTRIEQTSMKKVKRKKVSKIIGCPICNEKLGTDECSIDNESHIENCIAMVQLQNSQSTKANAKIIKLPSIDVDIDVENNDFLPFGSPQYTDQDLGPRQALGLPAPFVSKNVKLATLHSNTPIDQLGGKWTALPSLSNSLAKASAPDNRTKYGEAFFLSVIANQQHQLAQVSRCRVCLESSFKTPLVSTLCWHVLCEECWLSSLNYKRICPTCSTITYPECLRKIFL